MCIHLITLQSVQLRNDGLHQANDGEMLVNDGEMSISYTYSTIID